MKYIREYELFESNNNLSEEQIKFLDKSVKGKWKIDEWTGLVNVDGDFSTYYNKIRLGLDGFKGIRFGEIRGNFECAVNKDLKSLDGCPERVTGDFQCYSSGIETLEGGPLYVGGNYIAYNSTDLVSLKGSPEKVGGDFRVDIMGSGKLKTLKGGPVIVGGNFNCRNHNLDSLKWGPKEVGGNYTCAGNNLTSLEGAPRKKIGFLLYSDNNPLSDMTIKKLFTAMGRGMSYGDAVKKLWNEIPVDDAILLMYRKDSDWLTIDMLNDVLIKNPERSFSIVSNLRKYSPEICKEFDKETKDISDLGDLGF